MSDPFTGSACCAVIRRNAAVALLFILLAVATTGWAITATRDRPAASKPEQVRQPEPVYVPMVVPVNFSPTDPFEMVEVVVAARDLPVGTMLTRDELHRAVRMKKLPKHSLPPAFVVNPEELVDKRLTRHMRSEEAFHPQDLTTGNPLALPAGYDMMSLQVSVGGTAGFVGPGSWVDILATARFNHKLIAFPVLINVLVVAVDTWDAGMKCSHPGLTTVSFAVTQKQALVLSAAKSRDCHLVLLFRNPNSSNDRDKDYNLDEVIKLLTDDKRWKEGPSKNDSDIEGNPKPKGPPVGDPPVAPKPNVPPGDGYPLVAPKPKSGRVIEFYTIPQPPRFLLLEPPI
ncbi:MAG: Flp pilus assembly protein CpaB [Planctomycetia bacterium]|nr:Flp pilus assembly protein CpaB [Planctomycetia bacterium]